MSDKRSDFPCPGLMRGFSTYASPVTGEAIKSRQERERDLAKHDCVPTQDVKQKNPRSNKYAGE
jgi:hypothetical protein